MVDTKDRLDPKAIGTLVESSLDELLSFARAAHREIPPIFYRHGDQEGGFLCARHTHGFYTLAEQVNGDVLLLYSHDDHMFDPLVHEDSSLRQRLFKGFWLNPGNAEHIEIVEGRDKRDGEKWVMAQISKHNYNETNDLERFGYLWRSGENLYVSGAVSYERETLPYDKTSPRIKKKAGFDKDADVGVKVDRIRCYTTSGKKQQFSKFNKEFLSSNWGKLLKAGAIKTYVGLEDSHETIMDDFVRRTSLVFRGPDPTKLGFMVKEPELKSRISPYKKGLLSRWGVGTILKTGLERSTLFIHRHTQSQKGKKNILLQLGQVVGLGVVYFVLRGPLLAAVKAVGALAKFIAPALTAIVKPPEIESIFHSTQNIAKNYGKKGYLATSGEGYYWNLDEEKAHGSRLLHPEETNARPPGLDLQPRLQTDFAAHTLLDPYGAPVGSVMEKRRINNMDVLRIQQPDGLEIYNLVGKDVAYVRYVPELDNDFTQPMERKVKELIDECNGFVRVFEKDNVAHYEAVSEGRFMSGLKAETQTASRSPLCPYPLHDLSGLRREWERVAKPETGFIGNTAYLCVQGLSAACNRIAGGDEPEGEPPKLLARPFVRMARGGHNWAERQIRRIDPHYDERKELEDKLKNKMPAPH